MVELWGNKTISVFDVWSAEHFIMGISFAGIAFLLIEKITKGESISISSKRVFSLFIVLMISFAWEMLEHYIELGLLGNTITYWFQGEEHWSNRLISDNIMVLLGWFAFICKNSLVLYGRLFAFIWLSLHVIIFPHSMYLHTIFGGYSALVMLMPLTILVMVLIQKPKKLA